MHKCDSKEVKPIILGECNPRTLQCRQYCVPAPPPCGTCPPPNTCGGVECKYAWLLFVCSQACARTRYCALHLLCSCVSLSGSRFSLLRAHHSIIVVCAPFPLFLRALTICSCDYPLRAACVCILILFRLLRIFLASRLCATQCSEPVSSLCEHFSPSQVLTMLCSHFSHRPGCKCQINCGIPHCVCPCPPPIPGDKCENVKCPVNAQCVDGKCHCDFGFIWDEHHKHCIQPPGTFHFFSSRSLTIAFSSHSLLPLSVLRTSFTTFSPRTLPRPHAFRVGPYRNPLANTRALNFLLFAR